MLHPKSNAGTLILIAPSPLAPVEHHDGVEFQKECLCAQDTLSPPARNSHSNARVFATQEKGTGGNDLVRKPLPRGGKECPAAPLNTGENAIVVQRWFVLSLKPLFTLKEKGDTGETLPDGMKEDNQDTYELCAEYTHTHHRTTQGGWMKAPQILEVLKKTGLLWQRRKTSSSALQC